MTISSQYLHPQQTSKFSGSMHLVPLSTCQLQKKCQQTKYNFKNFFFWFTLYLKADLELLTSKCSVSGAKEKESERQLEKQNKTNKRRHPIEIFGQRWVIPVAVYLIKLADMQNYIAFVCIYIQYINSQLLALEMSKKEVKCMEIIWQFWTI